MAVGGGGLGNCRECWSEDSRSGGDAAVSTGPWTRAGVLSSLDKGDKGNADQKDQPRADCFPAKGGCSVPRKFLSAFAQWC